MILVTGASGGIGFECARELLERTGSTVMITGRDEARLTAAREALPECVRDRLLMRVCDQDSREQVDALARELRATSGELEGAILNVGVNLAYEEGWRRLHAVSVEAVERTVRTNCTHLLLLTQAVVERLHRRGGGAIAWVGSRAQAVGLPGAATYSASKAFLGGLARAVANEYGARGVRALLLHPGLVRTARTAAIVDAFSARHGLVVERASDVARRMVDRFLGTQDALTEVEI